MSAQKTPCLDGDLIYYDGSSKNPVQFLTVHPARLTDEFGTVFTELNMTLALMMPLTDKGIGYICGVSPRYTIPDKTVIRIRAIIKAIKSCTSVMHRTNALYAITWLMHAAYTLLTCDTPE